MLFKECFQGSSWLPAHTTPSFVWHPQFFLSATSTNMLLSFILELKKHMATFRGCILGGYQIYMKKNQHLGRCLACTCICTCSFAWHMSWYCPSQTWFFKQTPCSEHTLTQNLWSEGKLVWIQLLIVVGTLGGGFGEKVDFDTHLTFNIIRIVNCDQLLYSNRGVPGCPPPYSVWCPPCFQGFLAQFPNVILQIAKWIDPVFLPYFNNPYFYTPTKDQRC